MTKKDLPDGPTFELELEAMRTHGGLVAGVDEAGRGPWAGPVVAAAAILDPDDIPDGLNDSKKLSAKKRDQLFDEIMQYAKVGVAVATVADIDQMNILHASLYAMKVAVSKLSDTPNIALIDGNKIPPELPCNALAVVKGDARSLSIAAASIVAKVTRDRMMEELGAKFPGYGWEKNMGYGTKQHIAGLEELGVTEHHRRSFKPIKVLLGENVG